MSMVQCIRCDSFIDTDQNVEEIIYINNNAVCTDCATEEEIVKCEETS